jgi:hypothetical protein
MGVWGLLILPYMDIIKLQNTNQFFCPPSEVGKDVC